MPSYSLQIRRFSAVFRMILEKKSQAAAATTSSTQALKSVIMSELSDRVELRSSDRSDNSTHNIE
jgi:hypothetical protein